MMRPVMTAQQEREAIVKWLREKSGGLATRSEDFADVGDLVSAANLAGGFYALAQAADFLERGDHIKNKA